MAASPKFRIDIGVRDGTAGPIAAVARRLAGLNKRATAIRKPFADLAASANRFMKLSGVGRVGASMMGVARAGADAARSVLRIVEPLGVIAGAASIAGMVRLTLAWAAFGQSLGQAAQRAGLTAAEMQGLQGAATLAGSSGAALASGMTTLRDNMVDAIAGKAPAVVGMMQALHVNMRDASGQMRSTTDLLPELADRIAGLGDPTLQAQAATALFGGAGEAMLPFLQKGRVGIAAFTAKAAQYGLTSRSAVEAANRLREAQGGLTLAAQGFGNTLAQQLAPVLGPILSQMANWIARNREWISTRLGDAVDALVAVVRAVDWSKVGQGIESIATAASNVADFFGGWQRAAEGLLGFFAVAWMARILAPVAIIAGAVLRLPVAAVAAEGAAEAALARGAGGGLVGRLSGLLAGGLLASQLLRQDTQAPGLSPGATSRPAPDRPDAPPGAREERSNVAPDMGALRLRAQGLSETPTPVMQPSASSRTNGTANRARRDPAAPYGRNARGSTAGMFPSRLSDRPEEVHPASDPRPVRNNNPLDLSYVGQAGARMEDGPGARFARFPTMDDGVAAAARQLRIDGSRGTDTIRMLEQKYGPPSENDTGRGIAQISAQTGYDPDQHLNLNDPAVLKPLIRAIARGEAGPGRVDDATIDRGLSLQFAPARTVPEPAAPARTLPIGAGTADQPIAGGPDGQLQVGVRVQGPPGTRTTATQAGDGMTPLRVDRARTPEMAR